MRLASAARGMRACIFPQDVQLYMFVSCGEGANRPALGLERAPSILHDNIVMEQRNCAQRLTATSKQFQRHVLIIP